MNQPSDFPAPDRCGFFRRLLPSKPLACCAAVFLALSTLSVALYLLENWRGPRAWAAYQARAKARGIKLDPADYEQAPIPDEENFAVTPVFRNARLSRNEINPDRPPPYKWLWPPHRRVEKKRPGLGSLKDGERLDLAQWRDYLRPDESLEKAEDQPAKEILLALAQAEPDLIDLREAARRPGCSFTELRRGQRYPRRPPNHEMWAIAGVLRLKIPAELALGHQDRALADVRLAFRLDAALEKERFLRVGFSRLYMLELLQGTLWESLGARQWREEDLREVQERLSSINLLAGWHLSAGSERAGLNEWFDDFSQADWHYQILASQSNNPWSDARLLLTPKGRYLLQKTRMNQFFDALLARVNPVEERFYGNGKALPPQNGAPFFNKSLQVYLYDLGSLVEISPESAETKFLRAHTVQRQAAMACGLERYRLAHGVFPDKAQALVPDFLSALPRDVMDGQALRYRLDHDGSYTLWSIGLNSRDDQGLQGKGGGIREQPDWVWRLPEKEKSAP